MSKDKRSTEISAKDEELVSPLLGKSNRLGMVPSEDAGMLNTIVGVLEDNTEPRQVVSQDEALATTAGRRAVSKTVSSTSSKDLGRSASESKTNDSSIAPLDESDWLELETAPSALFTLDGLDHAEQPTAIALDTGPGLQAGAWDSKNPTARVPNPAMHKKQARDRAPSNETVSVIDEDLGLEDVSLDAFDSGEYARPVAEVSDSFSAFVPAVGGVFGPYRLLGQIAQGGMAEIYLALHGVETESEPCVIKRIHPSRIDDLDCRRLFEEEGRICHSLNHANIVRHSDYGIIDDIPYLAMEFVDGVDLAQLASEVILSQRAIVETAIGVAKALAYAHALTNSEGKPLRIVHRDISPQNILISRDGEIKLADFGIARFEGRAFQTGVGSVRGKLGYMAAEQLSYDRPIDYRADIFALGAVVIELLLGRSLMPKGPLLAGDLGPEIEKSLMSLALPVSPRFKKLLIWMCEYEPEARPWSATEVVSELTLILNALLGQSSIKHFGRTYIAQCIPSSEVVIRNLQQGINERPQKPAKKPSIGEATGYPSTGLVAQMLSTGSLDLKNIMAEVRREQAKQEGTKSDARAEAPSLQARPSSPSSLDEAQATTVLPSQDRKSRNEVQYSSLAQRNEITRSWGPRGLALCLLLAALILCIVFIDP
jgi:serine/threonine protein kinase